MSRQSQQWHKDNVQSPSDATNVLAHYGGMFDYFQGTFCLIHFSQPSHLNGETCNIIVGIQRAQCLGRNNLTAVVYWCYDVTNEIDQ